MESLARALIGFVLIYQLLPMAGCKVIRQRDEHEKEISASEVNYERSNGTLFNWLLYDASTDKFNETSIKYYTNATLESSSGSGVNSLTHMPQNLDARFLKNVHHKLHSVKRSFKKIFFAWSYYGPELGLCSCLFKYAWFTYPVVPEVTHAMMGRARRMVNHFMHDFWDGYAEDQSTRYRVSNKVEEMTADDYYDYRNSQVQSNYGPFRRVGDFAANIPENAPLVQKSDPLVANVVEMLKNLQPKTNVSRANVSDFVMRLARQLNYWPRKPNNAGQFRIVSDDGDDNRNLARENQHDGKKPGGEVEFPTISETNKTLSNTTDSKSKAPSDTQRAFPPSNRRNSLPTGLVPPPIGGQLQQPLIRQSSPKNIQPSKVDRLGSFQGAPHGLPGFNELPPADYTYYKGGTYHHVHDLRKEKGEYPGKGGGWLGIDFEETILQVLGLGHPRSLKPSVIKCSKLYALNVVLRFFQTALLG